MPNRRNRIRENKYRLMFLNIKLRPSAGEERYSNLFRQAFELKQPVRVRGEECLVIKNLNEVDCVISSERHTTALVGKFVKYTAIDGQNWFDLNTMEKAEDVAIPSNVFPNLKESDYFFFPEAHRLAFVSKTGFSANTVVTFLEHLLSQVKEGDEELEVTIITDTAQIEQILQANEIRKLFVKLSYSNADEHEAASQVLDELMRESNASTFKNEMSGPINPESELVKAMLELASNNGYAEASVKGEGDMRFKKVKTTDYPKVIDIESEDSTLLEKVASFVINFWRRR